VTAYEYRKYELVCDSPLLHSDPRAGFFEPGNSGNVRVIPRARVRTLAARAGWTHVSSPLGYKYDKDYCPQHKPAEAAQATGTEER
jgi:hypothetical protein